jgi:oligopeptide transport system ATP-binding protein
MSNTRKDGDFNLDEELLSNRAAEDETLVLEDPLDPKTDLDPNAEFEIEYKINPRLKKREELINSDIILSVRNLKQFFFFGSGPSRTKLKAVSNISFDVYNGECFGIVGESGCGKTTTGRSIINLYEITSGSVYYRGYRVSAGDRWNRKEIKYTKIHLRQDLAKLNAEYNGKIASLDVNREDYDKKVEELKKQLYKESELLKNKAFNIVETQKKKIKQIKFDNKHKPRKLMNEIQMIFQDPVDSLDPRMTVEDIIQEGLKIQGFKNKAENHKKVVEMLEAVGLVEEHASRYPHEFSGGQRQRIGIARALVMNPKLLICDEPISALDVSIRAQIINLLNELKEKMGLSMIFIAHDLSVVKYFCDRIAVMYYGKIVELASSDELFKNPLHPYTRSLLSAIPKPNPLTEKTRKRITYNPQEAHDYSVFKPSLMEIKPGHFIYCNEPEFEEYKKIVK